jgi:hypothetical protein
LCQQESLVRLHLIFAGYKLTLAMNANFSQAAMSQQQQELMIDQV